MGVRARLLFVAHDDKTGDGEAALREAVRELEAAAGALEPLVGYGPSAGEDDLDPLLKVLNALDDERPLVSLLHRVYRLLVPSEPAGLPAPHDTGPRVQTPPRLEASVVGRALAVERAANQLHGGAGFLVEVGADVLGHGTDETGEPWSLPVVHGGLVVDEFVGSDLAVATASLAPRRRTRAVGGRCHRPSGAGTGRFAQTGYPFATVAAPTVLEARLAAELLVARGRNALVRLGEGYGIVVTERAGRVRRPAGGFGGEAGR